MSYSRSRSPQRKSYSRSRSRSPGGYNGERRGRDNPEPCKIIGVFGLDFSCDEKELQYHFGRKEFGAVEDIQIIRDPRTRKSKGYGFIYYSSLGGATRARDAMNGTEILGKQVRVDYSATKGPHQPGTRPPHLRDRSPRRESARPNRCIGVFHLHPRTDERTLEDAFKRFGYIEHVKLVTDRARNESKGYGFVYYENTRSAVDAKEYMNGRLLDNSEIRVDFSATNARNEAHSPPPASRRRSPDMRGRNYSPEFARRRRSRSPVYQQNGRGYSPRQNHHRRSSPPQQHYRRRSPVYR